MRLGVAELPAPRSRADRKALGQASTAPANHRSLKTIACRSARPLPPMTAKSIGRAVQASAVNSSAKPRPISSACRTSARASSCRPAPSARARAAATAPPMPPLALFSISTMKGTTRTKPASVSMPRRLTIQVSAMATKICTTMSAVVGPARRSRLRPIGAVRRGWDRKGSGNQRASARPCRALPLRRREIGIVGLALIHFEEPSVWRQCADAACAWQGTC